MEEPGLPVLIVEDDAALGEVMARAVRVIGCEPVIETSTVADARTAVADSGPFAVVLLDLGLPDGDGADLLPEIQESAPETCVICVTGSDQTQRAVDCLKNGAADYLVKPVRVAELQAAVGEGLRRQRTDAEAQDHRRQHADAIEGRLAALERCRSALLHALCRMGEFRDVEPHEHLGRVATYSRLTAERLMAGSPYAGFVDEAFVHTIEEVAPLHDIGKVGVPDGILLKPGKLSPEESLIMNRHPATGRHLCMTVKGEVGEGMPFIDMAANVTGYHHERWDGHGYPEGLSGRGIPLSARIVGLADFYDVCRTPTVYRPEPIPQGKVFALVEELAGEKFDPVVVQAFLRGQATVLEIDSPQT